MYAEETRPGATLAALGYRRSGHDYLHESSPFPLEFPPGPLAVGDDLIERWDTVREGELLLHVITPTDSCRDRLAAFYHFADRSALEQAVAIHAAQADRIDLDPIGRWSEREGHGRRFAQFAEEIERS